MNRILVASDRMSLSSRHLTDEGYLVAPGNLARTGVQEYRAFELGLDADGMDPMKVIRLYRPAEEVFDAASMTSFEGKPVTLGHPDEHVTAENWSDLAQGEVTEIKRAGDMLAGTVIIRNRKAIDAVENGTVELSNGYTFSLDMTPGKTADGQDYDGVQRNIRVNHIALVDAAGDDQESGNGLAGRDAFMDRQAREWQKDANPADKPDEKDPDRPRGRAAFMKTMANRWKKPQETDDKSDHATANAQVAATWRRVRPDRGAGSGLEG